MKHENESAVETKPVLKLQACPALALGAEMSVKKFKTILMVATLQGVFKIEKTAANGKSTGRAQSYANRGPTKLGKII